MKLKTPIRYYGGKQKLLKHILPLVPKHSIYTEAFAGGLALFFSKEKVNNEIVNDTNGFLTNFYIVLQSQFNVLKAKIMATPYSRVMFKVARCMYRLPHLFSAVQCAWAFYILCNISFSGKIDCFGCYTKGVNAHSFERKKENFTPALSERLKGVQIECTDALDIIRLRDTEDTFHYVDPPYYNSNMGHYDGYTKKDFERLLFLLSTLKGKFLLSSYPSEILEQYSHQYGWYTKEIHTSKSASKAIDGSKKKKVEVLTANYPLS